MENLKIKHFMPSIKMYRDMVLRECTYFEYHNNTRFTISSRMIPIPGLWVNPFRSVPYVYRWSRKEEEFLPDHYKVHCREFMTREPIAVHWISDPRRYRLDEDSGDKIPIVNAPIPIVYPKECNFGLWGGEGIIFGYAKNVDKKLQKTTPTKPRLWLPELTKRVLYSEILDRYMAIPVTERARHLIDEAFGLDFYILQTHEVDLCSRLAMLLKHEMLVALAQKSLYPDDSKMREKVLNKYQQFVLPADEAEWVGLPLHDAVEKAQREYKQANPPRPLKNLYFLDLVNKLHLSDKSSSDGGALSKINPFAKSSSSVHQSDSPAT